ncbi:MAG: EamA family transporter [Rhodoferax sp.]|jgi:drug/metabolite transporter (DMT)-like permease|nr:EamA family transporter [Rhodoferax sp.]
MTPLALALVLTAAVCHATWNLVAKRAGGGSHFVLMGALLVAVVWLPAALWVGVEAAWQWGWVEWAVLALSALLHVLYFRALLHGYAVSDLTVVYPVARGSGPLLSSVGAVVVLGETISALGALGALAVVAGVFLIAGGPALWRQAQQPAQRVRVRRGLLWGAVTGVFIALYTLVDGYAVKILLISPILVDYVGNVLRIPVMLPVALRDRAGFVAAWRTQWRASLVVAILGPFSYVLVLYAVRLAPLSHVAPAREVSMLFAALLGGTLLGESDRRMRLLGAGAIAAGVGALAFG